MDDSGSYEFQNCTESQIPYHSCLGISQYRNCYLYILRKKNVILCLAAEKKMGDSRALRQGFLKVPTENKCIQ